MSNRGIEPFSQPMFIKTFWIKLISQMPVYIVNEAENKKEFQVNAMHRNSK